jgi:hypothetical protein
MVQKEDLMKSHLFVIAPMGTGKTTYARNNPDAYDDDDAKSPATEVRLKELRKMRDWKGHNQIWHAQLRHWIGGLPDHSTILCHSGADAQAMGATPDTSIAVLLPALRWMKQVIDSKRDALLAMENYLVVHNDAARMRLPIANAWAAVDLWRQLFAWSVNDEISD